MGKKGKKYGDVKTPQKPKRAGECIVFDEWANWDDRVIIRQTPKGNSKWFEIFNEEEK